MEKMKKFYISVDEKLSEEEKKYNKASYKRIIDRFISDSVLCNEIVVMDESVDYNYNLSLYDENGENEREIFQYYLCNLSGYEKEQLTDYNILLSYSDKLNLDILCVEHYGTSWDYVLTDAELTTDYEDYLKSIEENDEERIPLFKDNMIFDSIDDARKELKKVNKLIEEVDLDD